ncbi:MAG TPA: alpha/beta hydrolase [Lachnospiraceae bacterium]|nr:alpha/beta fold hydrolase [uncultured Lachnoclostridium sp.]HAU84885.1 alpha/beta hydrolase [Lachnospiraceae bacterium]
MNNNKKIISTIKVLVLSTAGICFINKLVQLKSTAKEYLYTSNNEYYNWKFGKIHYSIHGSGSPILLIHDLSCESSSFEWKRVINALSKNNTVYAIDLIGCGRSDKPNITYTNYLYVQLITDFIKNVIKQKTHIISSGYSCSASVMACYIEPQLIQKLTLINPTSLDTLNKFPNKFDKLRKRTLEIPILGTLIFNLHHSNIAISNRFNNIYFNNKQLVSHHQIEAFSEASHLNGASSKYLMASICGKFVNINISHALKAINNDIQIILGSSINNADLIKQTYLDLNQSIEISMVPNTKMFPHMEQPEDFISAIYF